MVNMIPLFILNAITFILLTCCILFQHKNRLNILEIRYLFYFSLFWGISLCLLILRNIIPDFFSIVIANTFAAAGTIYIYLAVRTIVGIEHKWHHCYWIPISILFAGMLIFTYVIFSTETRFLIYFSFMALYNGLIAWLFYTHKSSKFKLFDLSSSIVFTIGTFIFFSITLYTSFKETAQYLFNNVNFIIVFAPLYMLTLSIWVIIALF